MFCRALRYKPGAFERGVEIMLVFIVAALLLAIADVALGKRRQRSDQPAPTREREPIGQHRR